MVHRVERFSSTLKQALADIIMNDIANPLLKSVVITEIIVPPDLKKARVFVNTVTGEDVETLIPQLERAKGFIKRALARKMYLKYVPDLIFVRDESDRFQQLLNDTDEQAT